jgi:hypothetical protein
MRRPTLDFDKLVARLVALGVPGFVLIVVVATSGLAGGAAIVAALATLGSSFGMWGGVAASPSHLPPYCLQAREIGRIWC